MSRSSYRPLVAVVAYELSEERVARWPHGGYGVPRPYIDCLRVAGARIAIIPPGESGDAAELLEPFDGLLLVGGGDVSPALYGAGSGQHDYGLEPIRDAFEIALLQEAGRLRLPVLCICRGAQVANVASGGSLHQHLPAIASLVEHGVPIEGTVTTHDVRLAQGSKIAEICGTSVVSCSSHHHQGIDHLGDGLIATGWSPDGLVEALESEDGWLVAVQWHPEDTAESDPAQQGLFDALAAEARSFGGR